MTARLSPQREAEIAARAEAATKGPWWTDTLPEHDGSESIGIDAGGENWVIPCQDIDPADAKFIAHARADVPALLAELAAVRAERDEARRQLAATGLGLDAMDVLLQAALSGDRNAYLAARAEFVRQTEGGESR